MNDLFPKPAPFTCRRPGCWTWKASPNVGTCEHADKKLSGVFWLSYSQSTAGKQWTDHDIGGPFGLEYDRIEMIDVDGDLDLMSCEERDQLGVFWYENPSK